MLSSPEGRVQESKASMTKNLRERLRAPVVTLLGLVSVPGLDFVFIDELRVELTALSLPALSLLRACHLSQCLQSALLSWEEPG